MAFPTRVRYGLRLLVRLAVQGPEHLASMTDIALEENISVKYLEQIVSMLKPLGILTSVRGARGGYVLAKDPKEITLESVFSSLGGLDAPAPCMCKGKDDCDRMTICTTRPFWLEFDLHMRDFLRNKTLQDLVDKAPKQNEFIPL